MRHDAQQRIRGQLALFLKQHQQHGDPDADGDHPAVMPIPSKYPSAMPSRAEWASVSPK